MKNILKMFVLTWFLFHTNSSAQATKFLNALPAGTETKINLMPYSASDYSPDFYIFYKADQEVKL